MTLPASIRCNVKANFPAIVTGLGPVGISKANGVWSIGLNYSGIAPLPTSEVLANALVAVQDSASGIFYSATLASISTIANTVPFRIVTASGAVSATANDGDILINKTTPAATSVTLIACALATRPVSVKDLAGNASTNNITISPSGSETIDGQASAIIASDGGALTLYPLSSGLGWYIK